MIITEIIDKLNNIIWGNNAEYPENFHLSFSYRYHTTYEQIYFEGMLLWCSENDEREWVEENNDYEDLFEFCKREFCNTGNKILSLNKLLKDDNTTNN